jgi:hypothetical protein
MDKSTPNMPESWVGGCNIFLQAKAKIAFEAAI